MKRTNQHPWCVAFRNAGLILIAASLLTYAPLSAQEEKTEEGEETELIELPEFRVDDSQEFGYRATSSATAIRLAAQSIDLPMNISILPAEFIEDLAFDSTQEAARFISNVYGDERVSTHDGGGILYLRGFRTPKQRNGVESFGAANLNGVDRIEVIKGPVGVFYGNTAPGGIFNVVTKKPQFKNGGSIEYTYGSYEHHTVALDAQATALNNTLGVRLNGTYLNSKDWRDLEEAEEAYFTGSVRWNPKPRFDVFYEFEDANMRRNDGVNDVVGNPERHRDYANPPQAVVDFYRESRGDPDDATTISYLRGRWLLSTARWKADKDAVTGDYAFRNTGFLDPFLISPRGFNFNRNGEGGFDDYTGSSHLFNVSWGPTSWIDVRYQFYDIESYRNDVNNFFTDVNGDYSLRMRDNFNHRTRSRRINQQVDLKFRFNTEKAGKHTLIYGHEHQHNFRWRNGTHIFDWNQLPDLQVPADPDFRGGPVPAGTPMVTVSGNE